jgi:hypothetical protein
VSQSPFEPIADRIEAGADISDFDPALLRGAAAWLRNAPPLPRENRLRVRDDAITDCVEAFYAPPWTGKKSAAIEKFLAAYTSYERRQSRLEPAERDAVAIVDEVPEKVPGQAGTILPGDRPHGVAGADDGPADSQHHEEHERPARLATAADVIKSFSTFGNGRR